MALTLLVASTVGASTLASPVVTEEAPKQALEAPYSVDGLINEYSTVYGVSASLMRKIIQCESSFNPNAVGDGGHSRGLVQIHRPSWPNISDAEAFDPEFAINFLASKLSKGQGYLWSCFRLVQ